MEGARLNEYRQLRGDGADRLLRQAGSRYPPNLRLGHGLRHEKVHPPILRRVRTPRCAGAQENSDGEPAAAGHRHPARFR
jgi:hypothetical protein